MLTTLINPAVLEKGREEGIKEVKLEVAKNMLAEGLAASLIMKVTELPEDVILKLKEDLN